MNRNILIIPILLSLAAGGKAAAQTTNAGADLDWNSFQSIAQKNIFDPTRAKGVRPGVVKKAAVVRTFTFRGATSFSSVDDAAFFTGDGAEAKGYVTGDLINGFTIRKITLDSVTLAQPNGDILVLQMDDSMRREEEGPWNKSDQPAPSPLVILDTKAEGPGTSSGPPGESEVLKRLRLKREQENK